MEIYAQADVVADQFIAGFHGYAALEAMTLGKPVLCYLRDENMMLDSKTCPIINTNPDTLYGVLKKILTGEFDLIKIGKQSRTYVEKNYSISSVANRLGEMYIDLTKPSQRMRKKLIDNILNSKKNIENYSVV